MEVQGNREIKHLHMMLPLIPHIGTAYELETKK